MHPLGYNIIRKCARSDFYNIYTKENFMELLISERISKYRRGKDMTQDELAAALNVTPQAVSNWERGGYPDITMLPAIANLFGVTIDELMGNDRIGREADFQAFRRKIDELDNAEDKLELSLSYHRKYPTDIPYMHNAAFFMCLIIIREPDKRNKYIASLRDMCLKMMQYPEVHDNAVQYMTIACDESELYDWLKESAYSSNYTRLINYTPSELYEFLTDPRWAWFDSARRDERFMRAVDWAKSLADADENK